MKARIHFTLGDTNDSIDVTGSSPEEIREKADAELLKRGGSDPWAEILEE